MAYVLVADADADRAAVCRDSIEGLDADVQVAPTVQDALALLRRQGAPSVLVVDLLLPGDGGFAVVDALEVERGQNTAIIAWAASRELREFAGRQLAGRQAHVLGGTPVRADVLRTLFERRLPRIEAAAPQPVSDHASRGDSRGSAAGDAQEGMPELSRRAHQLCGTAGIAVYLKAPGETRFRASVNWSSDAPIPNIPAWMPHVFASVLETGRAVMMPDLTIEPPQAPFALAREGIGGIVAVPIIGGQAQIVGMICAFDLQPLALASAQIEALRALGGSIAPAPRPVDIAPAPAPAGDGRPPAPWPFPQMPAPAAALPPVTVPSLPAPVPALSFQPTEPTAAAPSQSSLPPESPSATPPAPPLPSVDLPGKVLDRRGGTTAIHRELARARIERRQLSVVLFVVYPLPSSAMALEWSNRRWLAAVCQALAGVIRESDLAVRWGEEEVLVVLPGLGVGMARQVAERVRAAMQAGARDAEVALAGGVAELLPNEPFESVVGRANEKVRLARERGHNRVA